MLLLAMLAPACNRSEPTPPAATSAVAPAVPRPVEAPAQLPLHDSSKPLEITVTDDGFVPAGARVQVNEPLTLLVTRKAERTCATEIVIKDYDINRALPLGKAVEVKFTPTKPGKIRYACAMDMVAGELVAE